MSTNLLRHYDELCVDEAPLDASVEQLEALTAFATATSDAREVERLLGDLASSITRFTDYRVCMVVLFTDEPPYSPRVLSYSDNVPAEFAERFAAGSYPREDVRRLVEQAVRIEVGSLGFAAYFPPSHYHLHDQVFRDRFKTGDAIPVAQSDGQSLWSKNDELFVPLTTRDGEFLGVVSVDEPRSGLAPDRRSVLPVVAFARQAAQLLERQRDADALAQQVEREALVNRITRAVRRSLDPEEVFNAAVEEMGIHLGADRCTLYMLDHAEGVARKVAEYDAVGVVVADHVFPIPLIQPFIDAIIRRGVLTFDDAANDPRIAEVYETVLRRLGTRSIMYAVVTVGDEPRGAFAISTLRPRHWKDSDVALARAVSDQAGIAIRQAELYKRAEAASAREALAGRLNNAVRATLNLPEVLHAATHELGEALRASRVYVRPYDPALPDEAPAEHEYLAGGVRSIVGTVISYRSPVGRFLIEQQRTLVIDDAARFDAGPPDLLAHVNFLAQNYDAPSMILCPLVVQGHFRGSLVIHQTGRVRRWTADEIALVESVAAQLAVGIAQAELFELVARGKQTWEATFDAMSDGIFIFDTERRLIRVNRAGARMEQLPPRELLGRRCCDILRTGGGSGCLVERVTMEDRSLTLEYTPEQLKRPLLVTAEPLRLGERQAGTVCTVRDLTELRHVEALARERQSLLEHVLESAREMICALDPEGRIMWTNSAATTISGYPATELIGSYFLRLVEEDGRADAAEQFQRVLAGEPLTAETRIVTRDGQILHVLSDNTPLVIEGRTTGVLNITRDITEQKQERERAAQADKLRALGQLASGVAHDFNNALAAIIGRAQLLRRATSDSETAHSLDVIRTAAEDAAATVRRIRAFARPSSGEGFSTVDVTELLRDAVEITRTRWENEARARGLAYDVRLDADNICTAHGNASELREVFVNMIVNAVDAMPEGGSLRIGCAREGKTVRVTFADTGTGMSDEVRERIFEPFYTTKGAQGTGLGLFVSYGIVERHKGQLSVESEPGRGSTFSITLPLIEACVARVTKTAAPATATHLRVLVVDDEPFVRDTLIDILEALGHDARGAASGREGIEMLESGDFDAVFSDLSMPGMDGWELAREVKERKPLVKVCIVTGYGKDTRPPDGADNPADAVVGKPFNFEQVEETISRFA